MSDIRARPHWGSVFKRVLLVTVGVVVLALAGFFIAVSIAFHDRGPPDFARQIFAVSTGSADNDDRIHAKQFDALVKHLFPVGSSEATMAAALRALGFVTFNEFDPAACAGPAEQRSSACGQNHFIYVFGEICGQQLWVDWTADHSKRLTGVSGTYVFVCP